jgi:hypothetical protein
MVFAATRNTGAGAYVAGSMVRVDGGMIEGY